MKGWIEVTALERELVKVNSSFFSFGNNWRWETVGHSLMTIPTNNILFSSCDVGSRINYSTSPLKIFVKETYDELKSKIEQATKEQSE